MSKGSYMPDKQADQVAWAQTFVDVVGPNAADYGLSSTAMGAFVTLNTALQSAWQAATQVQTRTRANVVIKDLCIKEMKEAARLLVSVIQGTAGVTDAMKIDAGVTVRKVKPSPKPVPTAAPFINVTGIEGRTVKFELRQDRAKRGKPAGVASATIFTATGPVAPLSMDGWRYQMITTLTDCELSFGPSETGDTVWVTAFWSNAKGESGPAAQAASANLPAGGVLPQANGESRMRLRAA